MRALSGMPPVVRPATGSGGAKACRRRSTGPRSGKRGTSVPRSAARSRSSPPDRGAQWRSKTWQPIHGRSPWSSGSTWRGFGFEEDLYRLMERAGLNRADLAEAAGCRWRSCPRCSTARPPKPPRPWRSSGGRRGAPGAAGRRGPGGGSGSESRDGCLAG